MKRKESGFTLVELMIVVAIIGILAAIAYPSYQDSVRKSRRAQAITDLYSIQLAQEKYRANNPLYGTLAQLGAASVSPTTGTAYYSVVASDITATRYTLTATANTTGGQNNDKANGVTCTPLVLNQNGPVYSPAGQTACWSKN